MVDNSMRKVIKGVIIDHRVPDGKGTILCRPFIEKQSWVALYNHMKYRFITHPFFTLPLVLSFGMIGTYSLGMVYKAYVLGKEIIGFWIF